MIKRVLGFDISSSTIGYCVLTVDDETQEIKFISCNYLKPIKKGTILERVEDTRNKVQKIIDTVKPDHIGIEDIIMFIRNKSTANTIITLATFNRMIGLVAFDYLGHAPEMFSVLAIRHGLKLTPEFPQKEEMPEIVANHLKIKFPYEMNKKGNIKVESYDMADGVSVALFHAFCLTGKCSNKTKLPKKKKVKKSKKNEKTRSL